MDHVNDAVAVLLEWLGHPALWATAIIVGGAGEVVQSLVHARAGDRGWRGVYWLTYRWHAVLLAAAIGLLPGMPHPPSFGPALSGSVLFYASAGALSSLAYALIVKTIRATIQHLAARVGGGPPADGAA